jgi:hypothetical protein
MNKVIIKIAILSTLVLLIGTFLTNQQLRDKLHYEAMKNKTYEGIYLVLINKPKVEIKEVYIEYVPCVEELLLTKYIQSQNTRMSFEVSQMIAKFVYEASIRHRIPTELIISIIQKESVFDPSAATAIPGKPGEFARGLMQIFQGENVTIDRDRAYDLKYNIDIGCSILNKKIELANGNIDKAVSNYSGKAQGYSEDVMRNVGMYTIFKWQKQMTEELAVAEVE